MLKDLDQSVDLLCDFYNLDLQLNEQIVEFLTHYYQTNQYQSNFLDRVDITKELTGESLKTLKNLGALDEDEDEDDLESVNTFTRYLLGLDQKNYIGRRDKGRITRFMNKHFKWRSADCFENWLKSLPMPGISGGSGWFKGFGLLELLCDFYTIRLFIVDILQNRIGSGVLLRVNEIFAQIGTLLSFYWDLLPKNTDEDFIDLMKVSDGNEYWELGDVKWRVNSNQLELSCEIYHLPIGFIMKKALADSIQAIINGEKCVRKCILCDRIFRVPKVNSNLKKYCGSGCRTKASKARSISEK